MDDSQCRTCLGEATDQRLSIDRRVNGVELSEMLEKLTQTLVTSDEIFSKYLCKKCFNDICNAYSFRTKFLDTERTLRGFEKKLRTLQGQQQQVASIKQETDPLIENFEPENEYGMAEDVLEEHYIMDVGEDQEHSHMIAYETEGEEADETQNEEYEQVECLEDESGAEQFKVEEGLTGSVSFYCTICAEIFKTKFGMQHHLFFSHLTGSNPLLCKTCNIEYPVKNNEFEEEIIDQHIIEHQAQHAEGKIHSCVDCFAVFKTLKQLETHKQQFHDYAKGIFIRCKSCHMTFSSTSQLHNHQAMSLCSSLEKVFMCYICNRAFSMGIAKKKHIQEDHQDKAGQDCPLCLRCKIPSAVAFENHYKTHFIQPRFSCNFCNQAFYESDRLQMHIRRYHDRTRYICFFCNKDFRDKSGIARHILGVHFNARNFKCEICSKAFTASYNLKEHMFAVHKSASTIYTCDMCFQDYLYRKQFERHREKCQGTPDRRRR